MTCWIREENIENNHMITIPTTNSSTPKPIQKTFFSSGDCWDPLCSGHGVCVSSKCHCDLGWAGPNCEKRYGYTWFLNVQHYRSFSLIQFPLFQKRGSPDLPPRLRWPWPIWSDLGKMQMWQSMDRERLQHKWVDNTSTNLVLLKTAVPEFCPCALLSQLAGIFFSLL